jgi:hypothetical protein
VSVAWPAEKGTWMLTDRVGLALAQAKREVAGSAAAPAARHKNVRRGRFIGVLLPDRLYCTRAYSRGCAMRAWIDRTNDGLSGMPADGISLPPNTSRINHATGRKRA